MISPSLFTMKPNLTNLLALFPPKSISAEEIKGTPPEVYEYRRDFGGKNWNEIPSKTFDYHSDAYCLMEHESLIHYISGFLKVILSEQGSVSAEHLVYFAGSSTFLEFTKLLSTAQTNFLLATIDHLLLIDDYFSISDATHYENIKTLIQARA